MIDEKTLQKLSKILSNHKIIWGVGGSYLLQKYDLYSNPADLDLWVQAKDMHKIRKIFSSYPEIESNIPLPPDFHYKILFDNLEVDFVACFIIKPNQHQFKYTIDAENIKYVTLESGLKIPYLFLEDWYVIYRLLKKDEKAEKIKKAFHQRNIPFDEQVIKRSLECDSESRIPRWLIEDIANILQISFFEDDENNT